MKVTIEDVARELVSDGIGNPFRDKSTGRYSSGGTGAAAIGGEPTNTKTSLTSGGDYGVGNNKYVNAEMRDIASQIDEEAWGNGQKFIKASDVDSERVAEVLQNSNLVHIKAGTNPDIDLTDIQQKKYVNALYSMIDNAQSGIAKEVNLALKERRAFVRTLK
jgi:hypothetical protein